MTAYYGANASLLVSGGSGSTYIPDGYIRTVEKIWLDYYTYTAATIPSSSDTILIGYIPANKKITGCEVYLPVGFAPTTCAINVGPSYSSSLLITNSVLYQTSVATFGALSSFYKVTMNNSLGMGFVCTSSTTAYSGSASVISYVNTPIYLTIGVASMTAPTAGTIWTILRYT